jgi:hypothetical protein
VPWLQQFSEPGRKLGRRRQVQILDDIAAHVRVRYIRPAT